MLAVIENTVEIARTPVAMFDYLADQGNEVHWNPDCVSERGVVANARRALEERRDATGPAVIQVAG